MQLPLYTFTNEDWSDVEVVQQTKEGVRGAWLYSNNYRGTVVVESQEGADCQLMGTVFLRGMSMRAPDSKLVERSSREGKQLSKLGDLYGLNQRAALLAKAAENQPEAPQVTHYIVMNYVKGQSYKDLTSSLDHIELIKKNLEKLGELAVYDLVLGSTDRFELDGTGFNGGNMMFEGDTLCPIDTDCVFREEKADITKLMLGKIVKSTGDYEDKIAKKLADNLGGGVPEGFSSEEIKKGMKQAIHNLVDFFKDLEQNEKRFVQSCKERGLPLASFPKHLRDVLAHINKCHSAIKL